MVLGQVPRSDLFVDHVVDHPDQLFTPLGVSPNERRFASIGAAEAGSTSRDVSPGLDRPINRTKQIQDELVRLRRDRPHRAMRFSSSKVGNAVLV